MPKVSPAAAQPAAPPPTQAPQGTAPIAPSHTARAVARGAVQMEVAVAHVAVEAATTKLPVVDAKPEFFLAFHPDRWMVHAGQLIPDLLQKRIIAGVSGVRRLRDGRLSTSGMRTRLEDQGYYILPHSLGPGGSYMCRVWVDPQGRGRQRVAHYVTAWERLYPGSRRVDSDERAYAEWCLSLVAQGVIPACPPHIARRMHDQAVGRLARLEERAAKGVTAVIPAIEATRGEIAAIEEVLEAAVGEPVDPEAVSLEEDE